jgi:hypothetical protein
MREVFQKCFLAAALCATFVVSGNGLAAENQASPTPGAQTAPQASVGKASIQFAETTFNFGEANEGSEVEHTFVMRNTGSEELKIDQVRPG